jgi:hypothetical protein
MVVITSRNLLVAIALMLGLLSMTACGGGSNTAKPCDLCTLPEHTGQIPDHCATGHGINGHRLECASCQRNCAPHAASLRCGNNLDSTVCQDGIY